MKNITYKILIINIFIAFAFGQHIEESKITCSHATTANNLRSLNKPQTQAQSDFDVSYYDIDLTIYPLTEAITGMVGITGKSLINGLSQLEIDLRDNMNVNSVGNATNPFMTFTHENDLIKINLPNPLAQDEEFTVNIHYQGQPDPTGYGSFTFETVYNEPMISTLSEPYGARDWWPCKDTPLDKPDSVDISVKVPQELIVASNGLLVNEELDGDWKTYHWEERYPIATYLVSLAIYPYTIYQEWYKYSETDSMEVVHYAYSSYDKPSIYDDTIDMLNAFKTRFGEYPFVKEKYGHAQFTWGGSMEHQTLSSMGYNQTERTVAHEMAHQWWGDMVTCSDFHHIWLNEGFATYSEALWYEKRDNDIQSLHDAMYDKAGYYFSNPEGRYNNYADSRIYVADTTSQSRIFDYSLTYQKAAWVMHMLRHVVGDDNFFNGLQEYGDRYRFKSAVTEEFRDVMEDVSGMDLDYFFDQWIYGELYPMYSVKYNQLNDGDLYLKITQQDEESRQVFEMPIDVVAYCSDNSELKWVIHNDSREQYFTLDVPDGKVITDIDIDPENWILATKTATLDIESDGDIPTNFTISKVFPNPFNSNVNLDLEIQNESNISFNIFDLSGRTVWSKQLFLPSGNHNILWNGKNNLNYELPSGTYFLEVSNDKLVKYKKLLLLK